MPKENAIKIRGANERERERESKRLRRFVINFSLIFALLLQNFLFLVNPVYAASSPWTQTDWSGGSGQTSWSDSTKYSTGSNVTDSTAGQLTLSPTSGWCSNASCDSSWKYRKKITFNNTDANLGVTAENLVNFPVLVKLSSSNIDYTKTQDSGQDIRFTDTDGSDLAYEIEKWDETGTSWVWVKVPQIDINSSTDYIYLYYGNTSATDHQQATSVWSSYISAWHLKETGNGTAGEYKDSNNTNNGQGGGGTSTAVPTLTTSGQINGAQSFDGTNDYIKVAHNASLNLTNNFSVSLWFKPSVLTQTNRYLLSKLSGTADNIYSILWEYTNNQVEFYSGLFTGTAPRTGSGMTINNTNWHYISYEYNGTTWAGYLDGAQVFSTARTFSLTTTTNDLFFGDLNGSTSFNANASIDEIRVSNTARSAAWIAASYKSETDAFNTFNSEEERYSSSGTLTSSIFDTEQQSNWGTLTYNTDGVATTAVKARTSNSSSMSGATDFTSCNAITSGTDISSNNCVTDTHRYIQYQISLTPASNDTPTFQDVSITFTASDTAPPSISLTALSPDPSNDNTPSLTGTATDTGGTVSNVQFQMDSTSGSWTACTADDGSFNSATEAFTCNVSSALSDGSHTIYVRVTDSNGNTTSDVNASTDTFTIDTTGVSVSLTAISPDPGTDTTPTISGSATATIGTISNVQFQVDSTSGTWTSCTASDGSFNSSSESFSCAVTTALSDGTHTIYVRAVDNASNNSSNASDSFTVDTTNPASFDLDSPGNNSYTNSERPSFKWKTSSDITAGLSKYVLEIDNPSIGSGQPSGDFTIDSIPTSGTTDITINNKYVIHFDGFSDSDSTNNYISVYTRSTNDWGSSENDGKLREGRVSWKVKAVDNAGNETSSSRTLFVDRSNPKLELTQINDVPFSSTNFSTTDKTPTIFGKITDPLAGGDSSQTQDENGPKIASGPKQVDIKVEKKEGIGYKLITLYTINMDKPWYTCDNKEVTDNSKQKCDKYLPFEYTSKENLELGTYKITLTGKDKADNSSPETTLSLNITTLAQITTPEEKKIIEEGIKPLKPEEQEKVKEELEITKPVEPSALEKAQIQISQTSQNILNTTGNIISGIFNGIGNGVRFTVDITGKALAFIGDKAGQALAFIGRTTSNTLAALYNGTQSILAYVGQGIGSGANAVGQGLAWAGEKIGQSVSYIAQGTGNLIASIGQGIGNTGKAIGDGYNQLANNAPGVTKTILTGIGNGVSVTTSTIATIAQNTASTIGNATNTIATATSTTANDTGNLIAGIASNVGKTTSSIAQNTSKTIGNIASTVTNTTSTVVHNAGLAIANATQNTVKATKNGIANLAFSIGEKTDDVSHGLGTAIIKIGYLFVPEPTKIANVRVAKSTPTSMTITWETNHPANGKVNYGLTADYGQDVQTDKRITQHEFTVTGLKPNTTYYYEVMSQNRNYVYDANHTFTTPKE